MNIVKMVAAALVALSFAACDPSAGERQQLGTFLGAIAGGAAGAQFGDGTGQQMAIALGALFGSQIGAEIGRTMDEVDRQRMAEAVQYSMESQPDQAVTEWQNPNNDHHGTVTPVVTRDTPTEQCREFQTEVIIGGQVQQGYGTACRQPDGSWQIQS